jgi:TraM recognition site of TraD and TraG
MMAAALLQGAFLQVLQALVWIAVYSVALGGAKCRLLPRCLPVWCASSWRIRPASASCSRSTKCPRSGLPNLTGYLATVGGVGLTMVLYAQALSQIEDVYGHEAALSILSNCTSQLFFPPREPHTAELISRSFGSRLTLEVTLPPLEELAFLRLVSRPRQAEA